MSVWRRFPNTAYQKYEPFVKLKSPAADYLGNTVTLLFEHEAVTESTENFSRAVSFTVVMPLRADAQRDKIKSATSDTLQCRIKCANCGCGRCPVDILVADELVPAFSRIVATSGGLEAVAAVELSIILPQKPAPRYGQALGRIVSHASAQITFVDITQIAARREKERCK